MFTYSLKRSLYLQPVFNGAVIQIRSVSTPTYVNTSTNQEELRDELILSEDNVLHTRKPTHLNEPTSDNIDEHACIHDIYRNRNSNYRSDHPDNKRSISDYLMFMNGCLIGWCC